VVKSDTSELVATDFGTVAVLDDDADQAKAVQFQLEDVGVEPFIVDLDDVPTLELAVGLLKESAGAVVCDVQLNNLHQGMQFHGAQLVADLVDSHDMPCVLITSFVPDVGMLIRPHRRRIPVLLMRDEIEEPEVLVEGFGRCRNEIDHGPEAERLTHRVPLFVERVGLAETGVALDARVGGWAHKMPMRFPATMLGEEYADQERAAGLVGKVFFALVNLGAEREPDLFFEEPELEFIDSAEIDLHFE
jgi:hypothetical protein